MATLRSLLQGPGAAGGGGTINNSTHTSPVNRQKPGKELTFIPLCGTTQDQNNCRNLMCCWVVPPGTTCITFEIWGAGGGGAGAAGARAVGPACLPAGCDRASRSPERPHRPLRAVAGLQRRELRRADHRALPHQPGFRAHGLPPAGPGAGAGAAAADDLRGHDFWHNTSPGRRSADRTDGRPANHWRLSKNRLCRDGGFTSAGADGARRHGAV